MKLKVISGLCLLLLALVYSCQSDGDIEFKRYYNEGSIVYQTHCQNCHGKNGEGLAGLIPPLTDTLYLKTHKTQLACAVKNGLRGQIIISGKTFESEMPAADLTPIEIAQVLTYAGNTFGNRMGLITDDGAMADMEKCR